LRRWAGLHGELVPGRQMAGLVQCAERECFHLLMGAATTTVESFSGATEIRRRHASGAGSPYGEPFRQGQVDRWSYSLLAALASHCNYIGVVAVSFFAAASPPQPSPASVSVALGVFVAPFCWWVPSRLYCISLVNRAARFWSTPVSRRTPDTLRPSVQTW
jgi:hypothetical protein